jgi:hypothetical protein
VTVARPDVREAVVDIGADFPVPLTVGLPFTVSLQLLPAVQVEGLKFLDQARLTEPRLADNHQQLPVALARSLPAPHQRGDFLIATNKRRHAVVCGRPIAGRPSSL